jgi:hypothetical protein
MLPNRVENRIVEIRYKVEEISLVEQVERVLKFDIMKSTSDGVEVANFALERTFKSRQRASFS